jgi:hypothetical protein
MVNDSRKGSLSQAIDHQSAEWLEANNPEIYDALERELEAGRSMDDIRRLLRRKFGNDLRTPFVVRVLQAADYLRSEMIPSAM